MASYLNIVPLNIVTLEYRHTCPRFPVLGSFRATLFTLAPVHWFRPFVGQHHIHDLGGAQTHVLLGGAFMQQFLAFVTPSVHFKDGAYFDVLIGHDIRFSQ